MSTISAILSKNSPSAITRDQSPGAGRQSFTRKPVDITATTLKDKATISPAALARELDGMFTAPGIYRFTYDNMPCAVRRQANTNNLQVVDAGDRVVDIHNGVITMEHVLQGDLSTFLSAARRAQRS